MKKWRFVLIIALIGTLQVTVGDYVRIANIRPDLLLVCVVIASITTDLRSALVFSAFAGLFKDIFSAGSFGTNTLLFSLWGFLIYKLSRLFPLDEDLARIAVVLAASLLQNTVYGLIMFSQGVSVPFGIFVRSVIVGVLLTTLVSPLVLESVKSPYP